MQCIGNNTEMEITFNPTNFRRRIAEFLIEQSEDMKRYYTHCFAVNSHLNSDDLVMSTFCRRFAHSSCIPGKNKTMDKWICSIHTYSLQSTSKELDEISLSAYKTYRLRTYTFKIVLTISSLHKCVHIMRINDYQISLCNYITLIALGYRP